MRKGRVVCHRADCLRSKARRAIFLPVLLGTIWTVITPVRTGRRLFVRNDTGAISHYNDVIVTTMASQITSLTVVYSNVYSDADQRKHQSSASLASEWEFTGTGEFPPQRASYAENVSIWWRDHAVRKSRLSQLPVLSVQIRRLTMNCI